MEKTVVSNLDIDTLKELEDMLYEKLVHAARRKTTGRRAYHDKGQVTDLAIRYVKAYHKLKEAQLTETD